MLIAWLFNSFATDHEVDLLKRTVCDRQGYALALEDIESLQLFSSGFNMLMALTF